MPVGGPGLAARACTRVQTLCMRAPPAGCQSPGVADRGRSNLVQLVASAEAKATLRKRHCSLRRHWCKNK